jgi:hypothetical protein
MAGAALTPRVRMMAICDGIRESRKEAGVFHLKGVRQAVVADRYPFMPKRRGKYHSMSQLEALDS